MGAFNPELLRGSLDLMVLSVLAGGAKYGYLLQQELAQASGGQVDLPAGTLYPLLHRLEADRLVRTRWEEQTGRRRKWYELTADGRKRLASRAREWHRFAQCLGRMLEPAVGPLPEPA